MKKFLAEATTLFVGMTLGAALMFLIADHAMHNIRKGEPCQQQNQSVQSVAAR